MKTVRHIGIVTSDMEQSLRFYRDLLSLKVTTTKQESGDYIDTICGLQKARITTIKLAADDGNLVELLHFHSHPDFAGDKRICGIGASHVAFGVESVEEEYRRLLNEGVTFVSVPKVSPDGYAKVAFCKDPDGVFIELVEVLEKR